MDQVRASAFLDFLTSECPACSDGKGIEMTTLIEDLGLDSLEFVDLVQQISEKFGPVPDEAVTKACTVKELWDAIPA